MTEPSDKWEDIVRRLMSKADDSAVSEEERDAIINKVTYLMAKYSLDEAIFASKEAEPEAVMDVKVRIDRPYPKQRMHLLDHIGRVFGCKSIHYEVIHMFGYSNDIQRSYMLFGSLVIQMFYALAATEKPDNVHGRTFNSSFVTAYVDIVLDRVKNAYAKAKEDVRNTASGTGMDLVLVSRDAAVRNAFKTAYPYTRMLGYNPRVSSTAGHSAGQNAGYRANIGQTGVAGRRAISS